MNVTRAILPVMRKQRSGQIITISSSAGFGGFAFGSAYAASKFGVEGWMESVQAEVEPFGIQTMIVNPGFFRTELLTQESTDYAAPTIADYDTARAQQLEFWKGSNGKQSGDPAKLAQALLTLTARNDLPRRFIAGADAIGTAEQKVATLQQQIGAHRELSGSLALSVPAAAARPTPASGRRGLHHPDHRECLPNRPSGTKAGDKTSPQGTGGSPRNSLPPPLLFDTDSLQSSGGANDRNQSTRQSLQQYALQGLPSCGPPCGEGQ